MAVRAAITGAAVWAADPLPPPRAVGEFPPDAPAPPPHAVLQPGFPPPLVPDRPAVPAPPGPPLADPLTPLLPQPALEPEVVLPDGVRVPLPASARQIVQFKPRYETLPNYVITQLDADTRRLIYTGGVIVNVVYAPAGPGAPQQEIEFATDSVVAWITGAKGGDPVNALDTGKDGGKTQVELFLCGDVVIRTLTSNRPGGVEQVLRANQIYYDVNANRAVALNADLEMKTPNLVDTVHLRGAQIWRLGKNEWRAFDSQLSSSKRPSDPNLTLTTPEATLTQRRQVLTNIFGVPYRDAVTGQPVEGYERRLSSGWSAVRVRDVPVFGFFPFTTDPAEPFGPLVGIGGGNDQIFGTQVFTTWDIYKLLARRPPPGHRWRLDLDYLSDRGPAAGTQYDYVGPDFLGLGRQAAGFVKLYGINDGGVDQLGFGRPDFDHPEYRGRAQFRHNQDLYEYGTTYVRTLAQVEYLSDRNFLEQYYKQEFDLGPNQDTFLQVFGASGNAYGSVLAQGQLSQDWYTITEWYPKVDGALIGETFLRDRLVYSARGSAGYAQLNPADGGLPVTNQRAALPPGSPLSPILPPLLVNDATPVETGRFNVNQRLSAPFDVGALRVDPFGVVDLTQYTEDLTGNARGRFYGGGGVSVSTTFSKLYPQACSELFNVRGLNHKVTYTGSYSNFYSDTPFYQLPQLDRLNDNAVDQSLRNIRPFPGIPYTTAQLGGFSYPTLGYAPSDLFNPQTYAIRRLLENKVDTLDDLEVVQLEARQRLQTKRGFPGAEHTVDWMTLNTSVSLFPDPRRDNFGEPWAFFEYFYLWHLGDRVSLNTSGWFDPFADSGVRYFDIGLGFNRPDGNNIFVSYRHTDPLRSRAVTTAFNYKLSSRYSVNVGAAYDFGINESLTNSLSFSRTGPDATLLLGVTYNPLVNNFGFQFALVPNVAGGRMSAFNTMPNQGVGR